MRPPIRIWLALAAVLAMALPARAFDQAHSRFARVLERFVSDGRVNYVGLKRDPAELRAYLLDTANVDQHEFDGWTAPEQLAFLLNVYNASVLQLVVDHYPVSSIRKIGGPFRSPWKLPAVHLWGNAHSLDWLEHEVIRPRYHEPRIHFALVCAAKGCPPLRREPYLASRLEAQLDDQTRIFLQQSEKNHFDSGRNVLRLSPIFKWYAEDFTARSGSLAAYVAPYLNQIKAITDPKVRIVFSEYDWSLNETAK